MATCTVCAYGGEFMAWVSTRRAAVTGGSREVLLNQFSWSKTEECLQLNKTTECARLFYGGEHLYGLYQWVRAGQFLLDHMLAPGRQLLRDPEVRCLQK